MRALLIAGCLTLASCAPPYAHLSPGSNMMIGNGTDELILDPVRTSWNQEGVTYPSQCNPEPWFPDGKVPVDFKTSYDTPETNRFYACLSEDAKAHATGGDVLFYMPESTLKTECSAADQYPDRRVRPSFYTHEGPEFDRYLECVVAEARRDGDRMRLAGPGSFPKVGSCEFAQVTWISSRMGGDKPDRDGGTQIGFDNGLSLVSYSYVAPVARSHIGDRVRVCVHDLPEDCPANDLRGIGYRVRNLRTGERWVMGDTQHMCRGA